jgi:hypothetical protein
MARRSGKHNKNPNNRKHRGTKRFSNVNRETRLTYRTYRTHTDLGLDVTGNIAYRVDVNQIEDQYAYYTAFAVLHEEVRVESMTMDFYPSSSLKYGGIAMAPIMTSVFHIEDSTTLSNTYMLGCLQTKVHSPLNYRIRSTWRRQPMDSLENEFRSANGNNVTHQLPLSLGSIAIYSDGPVASAGTEVGAVIITWRLAFKGLRTADNVTTAIRTLSQFIGPTEREYEEKDKEIENYEVIRRPVQLTPNPLARLGK